MKRPSRVELERLYWDEKLTQARIAEKFGVDLHTVWGWMKKYGIPVRSRSARELRWKEIFEKNRRERKPLLEELYWKKGLKQKEIAALLGTTQWMISKWMRKYGVARRSRSEVHMRKIDLSMSPNLAYILGVLKGDGNVIRVPSGKNRKWQVRLRVGAKKFVLSFKEALEKLGLNTYLWTERSKNGNIIYCVGSDSKMLVEWFMQLSISDIEYLLNSKEVIVSFLRGFYESEGCSHQNRRFMMNTDKSLVDMVVRLLGKVGFHPSVYVNEGEWRKRPEYIIYIRVPEVPHFIELVNPCIKR
jgi:transposase